MNFPTFLQADYSSEVFLDELVFFDFAFQNRDVSIHNDLRREREG